MEFTETVRNRRSIRKYKADKISEDTVKKIVETASYSPSWKNSQIVRYVLITDEKLKNEIAQSCVLNFTFNADVIKNAPALMVIATIKKRSGYEKDGSFTTSKEDKWEMFDAGIATQTFCLSAYEQGLGTVIMGIFDEAKTIDALKLEENFGVAALVAIGKADESPNMPKRKTIQDLLIIK